MPQANGSSPNKGSQPQSATTAMINSVYTIQSQHSKPLSNSQTSSQQPKNHIPASLPTAVTPIVTTNTACNASSSIPSYSAQPSMTEARPHPQTPHEEIWINPHDVYSPPQSLPYRPCVAYPSRTQKRLLEERRGVSPSRSSSAVINPSRTTSSTLASRKWMSTFVNVPENRSVRVEISHRARNTTTLHIVQLIRNFDMMTCLLLREQRLTYLVEDIGHLQNLVILDAGKNNLSTLPFSIKHLKKLKALILDNNQFREPPEVLFYLFSLRYLDFSDNPLMKEWKGLILDGCESRLQAFLSCISDKFTQKYAITPPPRRQWKHFNSSSHRKEHNISSSLDMTVLSYNILCPKYATFNQYPYCPSFALDSQYRRTAIMNEINTYNADVICLQEVDMLQLNEHYVKELVSRGYEYEFVTKNRGHFESDPSALDGCAIFWRASKFELVAKHEIRFNDISCVFEEWNRDRNSLNETMLNRLMPRDNTALVLFLRAKATKQYICITNGHLFWDPEYSDVKLMQTIIWTALLLKHLAHFHQHHIRPPQTPKAKFETTQSTSDEPNTSEQPSTSEVPAQPQTWSPLWSVDDNVATAISASAEAAKSPEKRRRASFSGAPGSFDEASGGVNGSGESVISSTSCIMNPLIEDALRAIPVLICGDFNSLPESGVLQYLTRGHVDMQHEDFLSHSEGYALESWRLFRPLYYREESRLRHGLELESAYGANDMKYTNYTHMFKGVIDYILFSRRHFTLEGYLAGIPEQWFSESNNFFGCPNQHIPSDHFPLLVRLKLKPSVDSRARNCNDKALS